MFSFIKKAGTGVVSSDKDDKERRKRDKKDRKEKQKRDRATMSAEELLRLDEVGLLLLIETTLNLICCFFFASGAPVLEDQGPSQGERETPFGHHGRLYSGFLGES